MSNENKFPLNKLPTDKKNHIIRDVRVASNDDSNGSGRQSLKVPANGPIATALDERTAPIRKRLGVHCVQRVGIVSMAKSCRRQVLHYDYSDGQYTKWPRVRRTFPRSCPRSPPPVTHGPSSCSSPALLWRWLGKCMPRCACAAETTGLTRSAERVSLE